MGKGIYKERQPIVDYVEIVHTDGLTGKVTSHRCNMGLKHRILKFFHLAHNCMTNSGTGGIADIVSLITGLAAPAAYVDIGIGTSTTGDASTDTKMGAGVILVAVTPTVTSSSGALKDQANWTHVFSYANDSGLTGTSAINEVAIENVTNVATTGHMLMHIAGATNYGAVDNCIWDNDDTLSITIVIKFEQGA
jgi:hypothetical protein